MKISNVELFSVVMPKDDPKWRFALRASPEGRGVVVKVSSDNGQVGYGFAGESTHTGTDLGGVQSALRTFGDMIVGQDPFDVERLLQGMDGQLTENYEAKGALEVALHDLVARTLNVPLYQLLGGLVREEIPILRILGLKEPAEMAQNAQRLVAQGYSYLKIKVEGNVTKDVQRVQAIREAVGDDIHLTIDANQSYVPKHAIRAIRQMEEYGIERAEQPVRADDLDALGEVAQAVDCPVEGHEAADSLRQVYTLVSRRIVDSINLSVGRLGGLRKTKAAAAICQAGNVQCRMAMTSTRIAAAAAMHLVASTPNISYACELGEFHRFTQDPASGMEVQGGKLRVPTGPGLGITVNL
ncbi:MAG: mandelate racemase/muconate lactonizing enzyme family protein [Chloroflexi bacterium]|nr:mandelate racemase/muconate lactonizing enzyme family protein [Chloroflexota bacterium]